MLNLQQDSPGVSTAVHGSLKGKDIYTITLKKGQLEVTILNIGCVIRSIHVRGKNGIVKNVVAGFDNIAGYEHNPWYFGCIVGRYANRINNGRFELDGQTIQLSLNEGGAHLHGGVEGFHQKVWEMVSLTDNSDEAGVTLQYLSPDKEEGYPGNLRVQVKYVLNTKNQFTIQYYAETDKATPVSLTNHSYFNLTGFEQPTINDHILQINASHCTEKNEHNLPSGKLVAVSGTPLDFSAPKKIGRDIDRFGADLGYDYNYVLPGAFAKKMILAAQLSEPVSGQILRIYTNRPGIQLYTANLWNGQLSGAQGKPYVRHGAVALETQSFPDSPNHPDFPDTIVRPGRPFRSTTVYEFDQSETISHE